MVKIARARSFGSPKDFDSFRACYLLQGFHSDGDCLQAGQSIVRLQEEPHFNVLTNMYMYRNLNQRPTIPPIICIRPSDGHRPCGSYIIAQIRIQRF
jgi:hypothetical protein